VGKEGYSVGWGRCVFVLQEPFIHLFFLLVGIFKRVIDSLIGTNYGGVGRASCFVSFSPYHSDEFHFWSSKNPLFTILPPQPPLKITTLRHFRALTMSNKPPLTGIKVIGIIKSRVRLMIELAGLAPAPFAGLLPSGSPADRQGCYSRTLEPMS
jgi:hypothetical protein